MRTAYVIWISLALLSSAIAKPCLPIKNIDGVLRYANGKAVNLFGFNLQPCISWEHGARMYNQNLLVPLQKEDLVQTMNESLDQIAFLGGDIVRVHLHPADFTDQAGNLVETFWLGMLDEMMAELSSRNIYLYLTLINHLDHDGGEHPYRKDSFASSFKRQQWMEHPKAIAASLNYSKALLSRVNPVNGMTYKAHPNLALIEPINEPAYLNQDIWRQKKSQQSFEAYKHRRVLEYINGMVSAIRETGAQQPILWNCGWPKLLRKEAISFKAISKSKVDGVSFCLYPGQDDTKAWDQTENLGERNYLGYLNRCQSDLEHLGWLLQESFEDKAKVVYEYETWSNLSAHLYPAMAKLFRHLGTQVACQWTYALTSYASHNSGTHVFNLCTTPAKAASWINAKVAFKSSPRHTPWDRLQQELMNSSFSSSFPMNLSVSLADQHLCYSSSLPRDHFKLSAPPNRITGRGDSAFASYGGSGIYRLDGLGSETIRLKILPHVVEINDHWVERHTGEATFHLDRNSAFPFELKHPSVDKKWSVFRKQDYRWKPVELFQGACRFMANAGDYLILKKPVAIQRAIFEE